MRLVFVLLHRWLGLFLAIFLFVAGLTGAIISWDHELDEWLNPQMFHAKAEAGGDSPSAMELANLFEAGDERALVSYLPLSLEEGHTLGLFISPKLNPQTGKAFDLEYNQVAIDPASGEVQATRMWGEISLTRENLLPFLYKLHYSLHIPDGFGLELGVLLFGIVGIVWVIDSLIALWISFPNVGTWRKSLTFRFKQGGYKLNFDLHRSGGVWIWLLLLMLAMTSVSMNLNFQVMRPVVSFFSELTPSPFLVRLPNPIDEPIPPGIKREEMLKLALEEAERREWSVPAGAILYSSEVGVYGVGFFEPGQDHADGGLGNPWLYFDGPDGRFLGAEVPGSGTAVDIFLQAQFPLHSGRILGLPGRIIISFMGLMVAMLSITGLYIWWKKSRVRSLSS
jgi:uncharacterized iron-regulated membrane protein